MLSLKKRHNRITSLIVALAMIWGMLVPAPAFSALTDDAYVSATILGKSTFDDTWDFYSLFSGGAWEGWHKGTITSDGNGNITERPLVDSEGDPSSITSGTYNLSGGFIGFALTDATGNIIIESGMNGSQDVVIGTEYTYDTEFGMDIMIKSDIQFNQSDFWGTWSFYSLASGGTWEGWRRGTITSDGNCNITGGSLENNESVTLTVTGGSYTLAADGNFIATVETSGGTFSFNGSMNDSRDIVCCADNPPDAEPDVSVFVKSTAEFADENMSGEWRFNVATSGGSWEGWRNGPVEFDDVGNVIGGTLTSHDGGTLNVTGGSYIVNADGAITVIMNTSDGDTATLNGAMNDSKDVVFAVMTTLNPKYGLVGMTRMDVVDSGPRDPSILLKDQSTGSTLITTSPTVDVELSVSNAAEYMLSEDPSFATAIWTSATFPLTTTHTFSDASPGRKVLYAKFKSSSGVDSPTVSDEIILGHPPVLGDIGDKTGIEGEWFVIPKITASDEDGEQLEILAEGLASGMRFFQTLSVAGYVEYKLSWPDRFVKQGEYTITFTASDGALTDSETITITIADVGNRPPILGSIGDQSGTEGEWFTIPRIIATDPDGDTLTITADNLQSGMRFFQTASSPGFVEYKFRWVDKCVTEGTYKVTFTASDGTLTDSEEITITIADAGNRPPILGGIGNQTGTAGEWFAIPRIVASDPDGDTLTITAENLQQGMRFFQTASAPGYVEYKLRWVDSFVRDGNYVIKFTASDGELTDDESIIITIGEGLTCSIDPSVTEGEAPLEVNFNVTTNGIIRRYWWNFDDGNTAIDVASPSNTYLLPSIYTVRLSVRDKFGNTATADPVLITVRKPTHTVSIEALPETGIVPLDVSLKAILTENWTPAVDWDFGDNTQGSGQEVGHTFAPAGDYGVSVTASDGTVTKENSATVRVFENQTPPGLGERALFVWHAWDSGKSGGWIPGGALERLDLIGNGSVNTAVAAADSFMESQRLLVDSSQLNKVYIRYKITGTDNTTAKLTWKRTGDTEFKDERTQTFSIIDDGDFHTYELDLSSNAEWTDHIVQLRFYPTIGTTGRVWVDFIRVRQGPIPSAEDIDWEFDPDGTGIVNNPVKRTELLDFCYVKGINLIFLNSQGVVYGTAQDIADHTAFINEAHQRNIDVYGLQGRSWWSAPQGSGLEGQVWATQEGWQYLEAVMNYGQFDGIIDDTEPYTAHRSSWSNNVSQRAQWYLDWVQGCKNRVGTAPFISTIPFWFDNINEALNGDITPRPLNEYVSDIATSICIMDYRDFAAGSNGMIEHAETELTYGPAWIAVEVQDLSPAAFADRLSFYEEGEAYMEDELSTFRNYFSGNSNYIGTVIHYYVPYKRMKP